MDDIEKIATLLSEGTEDYGGDKEVPFVLEWFMVPEWFRSYYRGAHQETQDLLMDKLKNASEGKRKAIVDFIGSRLNQPQAAP